jgi:predicted nuclease of predicted toxin-antitoxin system
MNIWIDAQISPAIAHWISSYFPNINAVAVRDLGLLYAKDQRIFLEARAANVVVMTKDADFVELLQRHGAPPKVLWITCGNTSKQYLRKVLTDRLQLAVDLLNSGESLVELADR